MLNNLFHADGRLASICKWWKNAVWHLTIWHTLWATSLGWGYFIWGCFMFWGTPDIHDHMYKSFWLAAWTCMYLFAIHVYKEQKSFFC